MRIAVYSRSSPDYLVDIVTDGLVRMLGRSNLHLAYSIPPVRDLTTRQLFIGFEGPNEFPIEEADILVASVRGTMELAESWIKKTRGRFVVLDGDDDDQIKEPYREIAHVYFKREYLADRKYRMNVCPLPFGAIPEALPPEIKPRRGVYFRGLHHRHPMRAEVAKILTHRGFKVSQSGIPKEDYNAALAASLVGVSVPGAGYDTYRYWETAYFGCALLSQRLPILIPDNFRDGEEAVFWGSTADFEAALVSLLEHPEKAAAIGDAARTACLERHLSVHRAQTVLTAAL